MPNEKIIDENREQRWQEPPAFEVVEKSEEVDKSEDEDEN